MRRLLKSLIVLVLICALAAGGAVAYFGIDDGRPSTCIGSVVGGRLQNGKRLPFYGANFTAYHLAGFLAGRTFMHGKVRDAVLDAYKSLAETSPELQFVYAEAGWPIGGPLPPHRSHSNGTSVDFMVPLRTGAGAVAQVPASVFNMLGYGVKFDDEGRRGDTVIDFDAIAKHLAALDQSVRKHGIAIARVIFEPPLQRRLLASSRASGLPGRITFMDRPAWVRHDQHYHVDFDVACRGR